MKEDVKNFIIGFTGPRVGMTEMQAELVKNVLRYAFNTGPVIGQHGDCIGADAQFDQLCVEMDIDTMCRPCTIASQRAYTAARIIAPPEHPLSRNKKIVETSSLMVSTPSTEVDELRSGTWSTIRHAQRINAPIIIITPSMKTLSNIRIIQELYA